MELVYLTYVLCLAIGFGISVVLAIRILSHPPSQGRASLMMSIISVSVWLFGYALEIVSLSPAEKLFWAKIQYLGIPFVAPGIFSFTLEYTGRGSWLTNTKRLGLCILPLLSTLLAFNNNRFGLIWPQVNTLPGVGVSPLVLEHGPGFYLTITYSYFLLALTTALLINTILKAEKVYRLQSIWMLTGMVPPWIGNAFYALGLVPLSGVDLTPLLLTLTNLTFLMGFLRVKLLDLLPIAQDAVFRSISEGVIVIDEQERLVEINPAAKQIFSANENLLGRQAAELLPGWGERAAGGTRLRREMEVAGRVYEVSLNPILNARQKRTGQLIILKDVTERQRHEAELRQANAQAQAANQTKTRLLANVSHDLRTPLGAILGYTEMLNAGNFGPLTAEQEAATNEILDSTNKLLVFINNLIGQAQIETGRLLVNQRTFNPHELIEGIRATARFWALKKNLSLSFDIDPNLPTSLQGDPYWLKQILLNLVNNALKFTEAGGVYVYLSKADESHWAVEVRDTGIGIPAEAQSRIFEAFEQAENATQAKASGSGLGLSIVRELVGLMNGQIRLESQEGQGSVFTILLPLLPPPPK